MFLTLDDAKQHLAEYVDAPLIAEFAALLDPVAALIAVGDAAPGIHQIGGRPHAGADLVWPAVDASALSEGTLHAGHPDANAENLRHVQVGTPMAFVAQIELAALTAMPQLGPLPDQGRLLFFYDFMIGPYENSTQTGRVIWDRNATAALAEITPPVPLLAAAEAARRQHAALDAEYGLGTDWDGFSTVFEAKGRAAQLATGFDLRAPMMLEAGDGPAALAAAARNEPATDDAEDMLAQYQDAFYAGQEGRAPVLRLLGVAVPEQDDPRLDAVVSTRFGSPFLSSADWETDRAAITAGAREWVVLAQLDVKAWLQDSAEGQIYFLIRTGELTAQPFDRVVCVYQQT